MLAAQPLGHERRQWAAVNADRGIVGSGAGLAGDRAESRIVPRAEQRAVVVARLIHGEQGNTRLPRGIHPAQHGELRAHLAATFAHTEDNRWSEANRRRGGHTLLLAYIPNAGG